MTELDKSPTPTYIFRGRHTTRPLNAWRGGRQLTRSDIEDRMARNLPKTPKQEPKVLGTGEELTETPFPQTRSEESTD